MNTIKRVWENPVISLQVFAPQECVAACSRIENIYLDLNGNNEYDSSWGEHVNRNGELGWSYSQNQDKRQFMGIKAYRNYNNRWNDSYISPTNYYVTTYSIVEVRRVDSEFWGFTFSSYYAYNATS